MPRFIHTADWQIGKPFRYVTEGKKRYKLQEERIKAISRIGKIANDLLADGIIVAGDLFDSSTVPKEIVMEVIESIGKINMPLFVIPGNHDHGGISGIWQRNDVKNEMIKRAPNMKLLNRCIPYVTDKYVLLPCPLLRRHETRDPTDWLRKYNWEGIEDTIPRVIIAHGGIKGFAGKNYDADKSFDAYNTNELNVDLLPKNEFDYIALGDWHNLKSVKEDTWYSGTPEPDRFDQGEEENRGQIIVVDVERNKKPEIQIIKTSGIEWHKIKVELESNEDIINLEAKLDNMISGRVGRDLLRIEISGNLGLEEFERLNKLLMDLDSQLIHLRVKGKCHKRPENKDLSKLFEMKADPVISNVARKLSEELKSINKSSLINDKGVSDLEITEEALCELYRLVNSKLK